MKKQEWKVDISRFIELIAQRMYSEPLKAGIRELITNSLDARIDQVEIWIDYDDIHRVLKYSDTGIGIDPKSFTDIYGKIASGHKRQKDTRGFFGIGRMSLIAASKKGVIMSYTKGKVYTWKFDREGWEGPEIREDKDEIGHGIYLEFKGIDIENLGEIEQWIIKTFSVPLLKKECTIRFQHMELFTQIDNNYTIEDQIITNKRSIQFYTKEEMDGILYICQKGILVREEPYTGLTAYVDQEFLDIKTDREGFINNEKYRFFKSTVKKELAKLRPVKSFEKMEVDFIKRLMRGFKRYWIKKVLVKEKHIMEKMEIEFPKEGEEIIKDNLPSTEIPIVKKIPPTDLSPEGLPTPSNMEEEIILGPATDETIPGESSYVEPNSVKMGPSLDEAISEIPHSQKIEKKEGQKIVKIRGAKPVDLGTDYPVIFYESDPFVLIFNTSHPVFKKLVEKGKLGSAQLALLFERMFECAHSDAHPVESLEDLKTRWKEVDKKLREIFK